MSDPNTAFPEYAKPESFGASFLVWFLIVYGATSFVGDIAHIIWILAR